MSWLCIRTNNLWGGVSVQKMNHIAGKVLINLHHSSPSGLHHLILSFIHLYLLPLVSGGSRTKPQGIFRRPDAAGPGVWGGGGTPHQEEEKDCHWGGRPWTGEADGEIWGFLYCFIRYCCSSGILHGVGEQCVICSFVSKFVWVSNQGRSNLKTLVVVIIVIASTIQSFLTQEKGWMQEGSAKTGIIRNFLSLKL